jgi:hypothetical protein
MLQACSYYVIFTFGGPILKAGPARGKLIGHKSACQAELTEVHGQLSSSDGERLAPVQVRQGGETSADFNFGNRPDVFVRGRRLYEREARTIC